MAVAKVQAIINGTTYTLAYNAGTGGYEKTVTAPPETSYNNNSGHYYPVTIKAVDGAGNSTVINDKDSAFGSKLRLRVKETVPPAVIITSPTDSQIMNNPLPVVNWTVTDSGSGVNQGSIAVTVDGTKITQGIAKAAITNGYQCSYGIGDRLKDGSHTVKVDASDNDGNPATQRAVSFIVDTVPPELSVTSPANNLVTNNAFVTVAGVSKDVTSGECTVTVQINGGALVPAVLGKDGGFTVQVSLSEGANTIVVRSTDKGGISSSITRIVTLDTAAPVIKEVTISPNPVSTGEMLGITVTVAD